MGRFSGFGKVIDAFRGSWSASESYEAGALVTHAGSLYGRTTPVDAGGLAPDQPGSGWIDLSGGAADHGGLTGLADDDHPQYIRADGTRDFTAPQRFVPGDEIDPGIMFADYSSGIWQPQERYIALTSNGLNRVVLEENILRFPNQTKIDYIMGLRDVKTYSGAGTTWTKPSWLRAARVVCVGGGGGGGGSATTTSAQASAGDGGSAGWVCESGLILAATLGTFETAVPGAAGSAGPAGTNGGNGGASSFGTHVVAPGGVGGATRDATTTSSFAPDTSTGGNGTAAGARTYQGQAGEGSIRLGTLPAARSGAGGTSPFGAGGRRLGALSAGDDGDSYGAGGSGGHSGHGNTGRAGGAGSPGLIIVYEYA